MKVMIVKDRNVLNTKFLAQYVNSLSRIGHDVHVVCDSYSKEGSGVVLDKKIKFTNLNGRTKSTFINIYRRIREKIFPSIFRFDKFIDKEKPDVIICYFLTDLFNVSFWQEHNIPVIMMMHCYPPAMLSRFRDRAFWNFKYKDILEKVSVFQVLMKSYEKTLEQFCKTRKVVTIPNEVVQVPFDEQADLSLEKKKIIYVARVEKEGKRQHLLIEAFAKIAKDFPDWRIEFWGLQKYKKYNKELMDLAVKYGIERNIHIMGYATDISAVYRDADIHAFPSLHEGFSLGLADGMALGLPSIGCIETPSVNELIVDGHNGFLVDGIDDFADKLKILMADKNLRIKMGKNAIEDMKAYAPQIVIDMWDKLIKDTVKEYKEGK